MASGSTVPGGRRGYFCGMGRVRLLYRRSRCRRQPGGAVHSGPGGRSGHIAGVYALPRCSPALLTQVVPRFPDGLLSRHPTPGFSATAALRLNRRGRHAPSGQLPGLGRPGNIPAPGGSRRGSGGSGHPRHHPLRRISPGQAIREGLPEAEARGLLQGPRAHRQYRGSGAGWIRQPGYAQAVDVSTLILATGKTIRGTPAASPWNGNARSRVMEGLALREKRRA